MCVCVCAIKKHFYICFVSLLLMLDILVSLKDLTDCITITVCTVCKIDISSPLFVFRPQSGTVLRSEGAAFDVAQPSCKS